MSRSSFANKNALHQHHVRQYPSVLLRHHCWFVPPQRSLSESPRTVAPTPLLPRSASHTPTFQANSNITKKLKDRISTSVQVSLVYSICLISKKFPLHSLKQITALPSVVPAGLRVHATDAFGNVSLEVAHERIQYVSTRSWEILA